VNVGTLNRRNLARLTLLAWAGSLAWLARRELGKDEAASIAEATVRLSPDAHFFAVKAGPRQIGYASITVDTLPTGFKISEVLALDIPDTDSTRRLTRRTELVVSRSLRLKAFARTVSGGGLFEEFAGRVEGDTVLRMSQRDGRERPGVSWTISIPGDVILPEVLPYRLAFGKRLQVGRTVGANVLDLATGTITRIEFAATAESTFVVADSAVEQRWTGRWVPATYDTLRAWRIEHLASGTPVVSWVDARGGLVHSEAALGVRLERSAFEVVSFNYRSAVEQRGPDEHRSVSGMSSLLGAGIRPDTATVAAVRVWSAPVERFLLPRLEWLAGGRQGVAGDTAIRVGQGVRAGGRPTKSDYLDPVPMARPIDSTVAERARLVVAAASDEARVAHLVRWVAQAIRLDTAASAAVLPRNVLAAGKAGVEGHAQLFTDLARSLGIRARTVAGVALARDHVYTHAWAEVESDGAWLSVDPTFGQIPASSLLIRIAIGISGRPVDLVPLMGAASFSALGTRDPGGLTPAPTR